MTRRKMIQFIDNEASAMECVAKALAVLGCEKAGKAGSPQAEGYYARNVALNRLEGLRRLAAAYQEEERALVQV